MIIADKATLDGVNTSVSTLGKYEGTITITDTTLRPAMLYYLLSGTNILCDRSNISIIQKSGGTATNTSTGYKITRTGYTYLVPNDNNLNTMVYTIQ